MTKMVLTQVGVRTRDILKFSMRTQVEDKPTTPRSMILKPPVGGDRPTIIEGKGLMCYIWSLKRLVTTATSLP